MKPKLLDLFCGAGGAAMGYHRAGFEVIGVDINFQPNYPFKFHQWDALDFPLEGFDIIHASPPCQGYTQYKSRSSKQHPMLIEKVREQLDKTKKPYIIENVVGAPLLSPIQLCGTSFGKPLQRHRLFEIGNCDLLIGGLPCEHGKFPKNIRIMNRGWKFTRFVPVYGSSGCKARHLWDSAMGIDWMTTKELTEAIPPAYTEYIGRKFICK